MGGLVSGLVDTVSDVVGGVGNIAGNALSGVASNPIGAITGLATGNYAPLIGSALGGVTGTGGDAANTGTAGYFSGGGSPIIINAAQPQQQGINYGGLFASLLPSLIQGTGGVLQGQTSQEAAQKAADLARQSGASAAQMAQFRPVGTTTRFGTSNFQFDPTTGQMTSAGYTPSDLATGYQDALARLTSQGLTQGQTQQDLAARYLASQQGQPISTLGSQLMASQAGQPLTALGQQYLGESPEAIRQRYVQQQTALLAPQQEQQLAGIRNRLFQTGRGGLATGATEAGGLAATNPEMAAYYNALANQQRQIAAGADQAAQQQAQFGAGLLSQGTGLTQGQQLAGAGLYGAGLGLTQQGQQFGQQLGSTAFNPFTAGFGAQSSVESAAQQPLTLANELAKLQAASGAQAGTLGLRGDLAAANAYLTPEYQLNPLAKALGSLGQSQALGGYDQTTGRGTGLLGGLYNVSQGLTFGGNAPDWTTGLDVIPESTFTGSSPDNSWMNEWWMQ
jgi:hypothetical protein